MSSIPRPGTVYLLRMDGTDYYKVGVSIGDIQRRLNALQTGNPSKLILLASHEHADPYDVEYFIHHALRLHSVRNEWFQGDETTIRGIFDAHNTMAKIDARLDDPKPTQPKELTVLNIASFEANAIEVAELYEAGIITNISKAICKVYRCSVQSAAKTDSAYQMALKAVNRHLTRNKPQFRAEDGQTTPATYPVTREN